MRPNVELEVTLISKSRSLRKTIVVNRAIIGGWTGRDKAAVQHHIDELAAIGVKPPLKTPTFYHVSALNLTTGPAIDVAGDASSGEVEYTLIEQDGELWVGAGSDHTDRHFEQFGITLAKQMCAKPIASAFWRLTDVQDHWDQIAMRSFISENGVEVLYQDGVLSDLLSPAELLSALELDGHQMDSQTLLFGGTTSAIGGVRFSPQFRYALEDPVLERKIEASYAVQPLPISG